jgi:colicin import membrane protein
MRARLMQLWNPPAGVQNPQELIVKVRIQLSRDGRLVGNPTVLSSGNSTLFTIARDNAIRALHRGQPFDMLSPGSYEVWKEIEITFDPRDMYRG